MKINMLKLFAGLKAFKTYLCKILFFQWKNQNANPAFLSGVQDCGSEES
jgi:hypothetical protein